LDKSSTITYIRKKKSKDPNLVKRGGRNLFIGVLIVVILLVIGSVILLVIGSVILPKALGLYSGSSVALRKRADSFLHALQYKDWDSVYRFYSSEHKAKHPKEEMIGQLRKSGFAGIRVNANTEISIKEIKVRRGGEGNVKVEFADYSLGYGRTQKQNVTLYFVLERDKQWYFKNFDT